MTADIQPPDIETRLAILQYKSERINHPIPGSILELIARRVQSNIRELEGALTRVAAFADLSGQPMTENLVDVALADLLPRRSQLDTDMVVSQVADSFGVSEEDMLGRSRAHDIALPRQIAMFLLREEANYSLPQIGDALGGRDHTTVMYGCDKVADLLERDESMRRRVQQIKERLYSSKRNGSSRQV